LRRLFTSNFRTTCARPGVDWDLANVVQKKGESLREYIQCFYNKRNVIPEVDDKSIVMFFMKGLRYSSLIQKLTMKNPGMSEQMFSITNRYALAEEATLNTREQKKESGHPDQPSSSKGHDKKRKLDRSVNVVERSRHHKDQPKPVNLKASWITFAFSTPRESTRPKTVSDSKVLQMRFSRRPSRPIMRRSLRIPRVTSPRHTRLPTIFLVALTHMRPRGSKNSQSGRSWRSVSPPPSTLDGPRSPLPSTAVTTRTLFQSRVVSSGSLPHRKRHQFQQSASG
jgi:hypothetical protein